MTTSKFILLLTAGICALAFIAVLLLHNWLPGTLSGKIEDVVRNSMNPDSTDLYRVEAGTSSFSPLFRTTSISEVRITPKDIAFIKKNAGLLPIHIYGTEVYNLKISSWALLSMAMGRKSININRLTADSIFLVIYNNEVGIIKVDTTQSRTMDHLHFKKVSASKFRIKKRTLSDSSSLVLQTGKLDFAGEISFFDEEKDTLRKPGIKAHSLRVINAEGSSTHGLYHFHIDSIFFDGKAQTADLNRLRMTPLYSKENFHKRIQFKTNRFDLMLDHIKISGLQQDRMFQDGTIVLSQMEINGGKMGVFRDRKPPFNVEQRPLMPARQIQEASFGLHAGKIELKNLDVVYEELPEDAGEMGEVTFKQLYATITNISNLKDSLASNNLMNIDAQALFFGTAMLKAEFKYNLADPGGSYEATGELASLNFVDINLAIYPLAGKKVIGGRHQSSSFYFHGNDVRSTGELRMQYSGLEIELVPDGRKVVKKLAGFVGKNVLYYQANPSKNNELRVGKIEYDRDISRSFFHYWWNSFLTGVKDSMLQEHLTG